MVNTLDELLSTVAEEMFEDLAFVLVMPDDEMPDDESAEHVEVNGDVATKNQAIGYGIWTKPEHRVKGNREDGSVSLTGHNASDPAARTVETSKDLAILDFIGCRC